jgi:hypothetical protein
MEPPENRGFFNDQKSGYCFGIQKGLNRPKTC